MGTPTVSVLLPVHNAERYLNQAVESVLAQTFTDFELLVLDDGSTDRSLAILREFEARDGRVRVWSQENRGLVETLNELIGKARGRYLARMDADDICRPQRFEKQVAFLGGEASPFSLFPPNILARAQTRTLAMNSPCAMAGLPGIMVTGARGGRTRVKHCSSVHFLRRHGACSYSDT